MGSCVPLFIGSKSRRCNTLLYGLYRNAQDPEDGREKNSAVFLKLIYIYSNNQSALEIFPVPSLKMNGFQNNYYKGSTALSSVLSSSWDCISGEVSGVHSKCLKLPMTKFTTCSTQTRTSRTASISLSELL